MSKLSSEFRKELQSQEIEDEILSETERKLATVIQITTALLCGGFSATQFMSGSKVVGGLFAIACIAQIIEIPLFTQRHKKKQLSYIENSHEPL